MHQVTSEMKRFMRSLGALCFGVSTSLVLFGAVVAQAQVMNKIAEQLQELHFDKANDCIDFRIQTRERLGKATLVVANCFSAAYNVRSIVYLVTGKKKPKIKTLQFDDYSQEEGWTTTPHLFNVSFDKKSGKLTSFYKGRGLGDCGSQGTWMWDGQAFNLLTFRSKEECDGEDTEWPLVKVP